jgi:hypothetical protein
MATYIGTKGNDFINGPVVAKDSNIDGDEGDDTVIVGTRQIYISGPGNDIIKGNGLSEYALWFAKGPATVDLFLGYALDGYGFKDSIEGINTVHGSQFGLTVIGTTASESVYIFGGKNSIDLGGGDDTVVYWDQKSIDYSIVFNLDHFEVKKTGEAAIDILRGVEFIEFKGGAYFDKRIDLNDYIPSAFTIHKGELINNADAIGNPRWVVTSLNNDSSKDLAIRFDPDSAFIAGTIAHSPIHFFLGTSDGKFKQAPAAMSDNLAPTLVNRILTADFNNDGLGDIVIAASGQDPYADGKPLAGSWGGEKSYVLMSGTDAYKSITIPNIPSIFSHHASIGDIDGDGAIDIFIDSISSGTGGASYFLISDKKASFVIDRTRLPDSVKNPQKIERTDLSTINKKIYDKSIYTSSAIFDANNDGYLDLALLPIGGTYRGVIFLNDGKGNFSDSSKLLLPVGPYGGGYEANFSNNVTETAGSIYLDTKSIDINGDGRLDLVSVVTKDFRVGSTYEYYKGTAVQVLINKQDGFVDESISRVNFTHAPESNYSHYDTIDTVDINADGFVDMVLYRGLNSPDQANSTRILLNDGSGHYKESQYPAGIPKGLLIPIDLLSGEYLVVANAGNLNQSGQISYQFRVDGVHFDWGLGLDFFSSKAVTAFDQMSGIPGRWLHGTNDSNKLVLSSASEKAFGYSGNDQLTGLAGDDFLDGGIGLDFAMYRSKRSDYFIGGDPNGKLLVEDQRVIFQLSDKSLADGKDQLLSVERLVFSDKSIALDFSGSAGTTAKILGAVFGKDSLTNKNYVGIGLHFLDAGWTYDNLAGLALDAAGAKTNDQIVSLLWTNVIGSKPTAADKAPYIALLENGMTAGALAHLAADSSFNTTNINLVGLAQTGIEYIPIT